MWQQFCGLMFSATVAIFAAGCSLVQPVESKVQPERARQMSMAQLKEMESFFVKCETSLPTLDPKQLKAGQHIQVLTGGMPDNEFPDSVALPTRVAGTVKVVTADHVVLQDVMMIREGRSQNGVPVVSKVPYFSRYFKNTGVGRASTAVPGELAIELSSILHAGELSEFEFDAMQKNRQPQRIGVDFDFNVEDGRLADRPVITKQVQEGCL